MKRYVAVLKWLLLGWGAVSLIGLAAMLGVITYNLTIGNRDKADKASSSDVRFVLNWCNLGDGRIERVVHSHVSARSFTGDHLDAFAIKIRDVTLAELTRDAGGSAGRWYRGDQLPKALDDAVAFVGGFSGSGEIAWFPKESELRSSEVYVYPWSIYLHGVQPTAAELIFIRPKDKMVFFFGGKT